MQQQTIPLSPERQLLSELEIASSQARLCVIATPVTVTVH
jgi:hypothetical protein